MITFGLLWEAFWSHFSMFFRCVFRGCFLTTFWCNFGGIWAPWGDPKGAKREQKRRFFEVPPFGKHFGRIWGAFWEDLGSILGGFWEAFGGFLGGLGQHGLKKFLLVSVVPVAVAVAVFLLLPLALATCFGEVSPCFCGSCRGCCCCSCSLKQAQLASGAF